MTNAIRDENFITVALGVSSTSATTTLPFTIDSATGRLLTDVAGGSGDVVGPASATDNAVARFDGTTGKLIQNSAVIIADTTGNISGAQKLTLGVAATATGSLELVGTTSGTVTLKVADAAGTWTLTLPTGDGDAGQVLQTDGAGVTSWATVSAAAGGLDTEVQYNNGGALGGITGFAYNDGTGALTVNTTTFTTSVNLTPTANDGAALGTASLQFSDLFLAEGGVINWDGGDVTITQTNNVLAVAGTTSTTFDGQVNPATNDAASLGTTALGWSDLHLATGGVINWANGEMTITETNANLLTVAGGAFAVSGAISGASSLTLGAAAGTTGSVVLTGTTSGAVTLSVADAAGTWTLKLPTTDGNANEFLQTDGSGNTTWAAGSSIPATTITVANEATDTTCFPVFVTAATGDLGPKSNTGLTFNSNTASLGATLMTATTSLTTAALRASSNDSGSIGVSGTAFSDLFLASGAVIDFAAGNSVITHSSAVLTVSTGDLRVTTAGTNSASVVTVGGTQTLTSKTLTSPTITTATLSGAQQLAEGAGLRLDAALSADGTYSGTTISGTAGATLAFGDICYLAAADSRWELADADAATTAGGVLIGFCVLAAAADGDPTVILLDGNIRADAAFPVLTVGAPAYISTTAGDIQTTAPSGTDDVVQVVGFGLTADSLLVRISPDYITRV